MEEFYVITPSGRSGPYRTISKAWSVLLFTTGSIEVHNHSGDPDIPKVWTAAVHTADGRWETTSVVPAE
jgi:hypothetical protein